MHTMTASHNVAVGRKASSPPTSKPTPATLPAIPITPTHSQSDFSADFTPTPAKRPNIPSANTSFEQFRKRALENAEKVVVVCV